MASSIGSDVASSSRFVECGIQLDSGQINGNSALRNSILRRYSMIVRPDLRVGHWQLRKLSM